MCWDRETKELNPTPIGWTGIQATWHFKIAKNANAAWRIVPEDHDIIYAGDDTRVTPYDHCGGIPTLEALRDVAYSDPKIGIVAAQIKGHQYRKISGPFIEENFVPFVFVYIKRDVTEKIGYLDERFEGYGVEDVEFCVRARQAGFRIGFANEIKIKHGVNGHSFGSTFKAVQGEKKMFEEDAENWKRFCEKFKITPPTRDRAWQFVEHLK